MEEKINCDICKDLGYTKEYQTIYPWDFLRMAKYKMTIVTNIKFCSCEKGKNESTKTP